LGHTIEMVWMRIWQKMLEGIQKGMQEGIQESLRELQDQLARGFLDPAKLAEMMKRMGIDMSQLSGIMGQTPGLDPYKVLGLDKSASDEQIKKRYHDLLHKLHPDTSGVEGTEFLTQIVVGAYEMIRRERGW